MGTEKGGTLMQNTPQDTQPESWQRFFASAANNRAWQLADARSPRRELRHRADPLGYADNATWS